MTLFGSLVPLITPFSGGEIDYDSFASLIEFHIREGTHGLIPCGSTGESCTLTHDEQTRLIRFTVETVRGRLPVIGGTGANSTREAVALAQSAKDAGVTAHLSIVPYYNKPSQEGIYRHFMQIADSVELPMLLYNQPARCGVNLEPETTARLFKHPNIIGLKEGMGNMTQILQTLELCGPDFLLFSGDDFVNYPVLAAGGAGLISVTANLIPHTIARMCEDAREGRLIEALKTHQSLGALNRAMFLETNPVPVKAASHLLGLIPVCEYRLPLCEMSAQNTQALQKTLEAAGLI